MNGVMLCLRRYHDDVRRQHVERPLGHPIRGAQQHADEYLHVCGSALCADAFTEGADTQREVTDSQMGNASAQFAAAELQDIKMRTLDCLLQTLEAIEIASFDSEVLGHRHPRHCCPNQTTIA
ncbi:hypothetical protein [Bradyrhizobium sp.]|uniref:hypothetical protein n=1 Tax=Bradyrhizobium sp. TaxID=376 RepID=UPI002605A0A2|nr:hypothetical protein [Bradyrhizobium sp.]